MEQILSNLFSFNNTLALFPEDLVSGPGSDYVSPCGRCSFIMQILFAVLSVVYDKAPHSLEKKYTF